MILNRYFAKGSEITPKHCLTLKNKRQLKKINSCAYTLRAASFEAK